MGQIDNRNMKVLLRDYVFLIPKKGRFAVHCLDKKYNGGTKRVAESREIGTRKASN